MNNNSFYDPTDPRIYQTGSTKPPKSHRGMIAFLLVLVILLLGAVTLLGAVNIKMFRQLKGDARGETLGISFSSQETGGISSAQTAEENDPISDPVQISTTPAAEGNYQQAEGMSLQEIYASTIDSVVSVLCSYRGGSSSGTGVVLTSDGYIVTNYHVVEGAQTIQILLQNDQLLDARLIGSDELSDLAVLQVNATGLSCAQLGDSSKLQVGDAVVAIGDPLGTELRGTMTNGIISAINRDVNAGGRVMNLIQTNAALNSGNSGGPLINCYGQVVGINTMKMGDTMSVAGVEGLGFAIPSNTVSTIVNQLILQGFVSGRPTLGITGEAVSDFYQVYYGLPSGLYITQVEEGSSAAEIGLRAGDILLTLDGSRISGLADYETVLYASSPGDLLDITIYRNGRQYTATITVDEAKN